MRGPAARVGRLPAGTSAGFTVLELVVVMGIVVVVLMISAGAFQRVARIASVQTSSSDSNIQGIVGLEIMRTELAQAGYGLPWTPPGDTSFVASYEESQVPANALANGIDPKVFNNANNLTEASRSTRDIESAAATGAQPWENGRDYLVIKGTSLAMNPASKHWSYLEGLGATSSIRQWGNATDDLVPNDRVITLKSVTVEQKPYRKQVAVSNADFSYKVPALVDGKYTPPAAYQADSNDSFWVYGVSDVDLKFPFNRVDYYIRRPAASEKPGIPLRCAPGTGVLYKANLRHSDQLVDQYPLLDCVADMQVVYSLDTNEDGGVDLHGDEDILSALSAEEIRNQLKEIRVYVLTHDGGKDSSFSYPSSTVRVGGFGAGRDYNLAALEGIGTAWKNYRWKIYSLVVER